MKVTLDPANRSHWLATEHGSGGEIAKEELYPVAVMTLPRVGEIRAEMEANRYRHTGGWSDWRIFVRNVEPSSGVGEKTLRVIREAAEPVIREWLASEEYADSRRIVARHMLVRIIREAGSRYGLDGARRELARHGHELSPADAEKLGKAIDLLEQASALLD